jgi:hypothetical protein
MAITVAKRKSLPKSSFGLPGARKYPVDTPARARNALSRAAQNATPAQQSQIKAKVKAKYPSIKVAGKRAAR